MHKNIIKNMNSVIQSNKKALMSLLFLFLATTSSAVDCGPKSGGKLCPQGACCAYNGYCGKADIYCDPFLCISQCPISKIISERIYNQIFPNRNDKDCSAKDFYTYRAFIEASKSFPAFGATGNDTVRLREIAAFLGQTSFETRGNDDSKIAADVRYKTGYCKIEIDDKIVWCNWESEWDCVYGRNYYGRGPWGNKFVSNDIYGPCGIALGLDLLMNPGLVSYDPVISFSAALWFWMTPQSNNKPSSHAVMVGEWVPTQADVNAGRLPGYGAITNIINGGLECGGKITWEEAQRLGFYQRICDIIGIPYGNNLNCFGQQPFGQGRIQDFKSGKTIIDKKRTKSIDI